LSDHSEDKLRLLQSIVQNGEDRLTRQRAIIGLMERDNQLQAVQRARQVLTVMEAILEWARERLQSAVHRRFMH
jgi:hypothetical protein